MVFVSCVVSYMLRTNLSLNILAMVQSSNSSYVPPAPETPLFADAVNITGMRLKLAQNHEDSIYITAVTESIQATDNPNVSEEQLFAIFSVLFK